MLDQLSTKAGVAALLPGTGAAGLKTRQVAMYGHSVGGAAAAEAMRLDCRVVAGANLDGSMFGPVVQQGVRGPFLLFGHENKTRQRTHRGQSSGRVCGVGSWSWNLPRGNITHSLTCPI